MSNEKSNNVSKESSKSLDEANEKSNNVSKESSKSLDEANEKILRKSDLYADIKNTISTVDNRAGLKIAAWGIFITILITLIIEYCWSLYFYIIPVYLFLEMVVAVSVVVPRFRNIKHYEKFITDWEKNDFYFRFIASFPSWKKYVDYCNGIKEKGIYSIEKAKYDIVLVWFGHKDKRENVFIILISQWVEYSKLWIDHYRPLMMGKNSKKIPKNITNYYKKINANWKFFYDYIQAMNFIGDRIREKPEKVKLKLLKKEAKNYRNKLKKRIKKLKNKAKNELIKNQILELKKELKKYKWSIFYKWKFWRTLKFFNKCYLKNVQTEVEMENYFSIGNEEKRELDEIAKEKMFKQIYINAKILNLKFDLYDKSFLIYYYIYKWFWLKIIIPFFSKCIKGIIKYFA